MFAFVLFWAAAAPSVGLFGASDYPPSALARNEQGSVLFQVVVRPDGTPDTCSILVSSGYKDLDDVTCKIVLERARFSPATDLNNKPTYGVTRSHINWAIDRRSFPPIDSPDVELTLNQAPPGMSLPREVSISFFHGAGGSVGGCSADKGEKDPPAILVDLACKYMSQSPGDPIRNREGRAVDGRDMATVRFSLQK